MKKILFLALIVIAIVACDNNTNNAVDSTNNAFLFEQVKDPAATDTTLIRFTIGIKGNSSSTGMCYCYPQKDSTSTPPTNVISKGTFIKLTTNPLSYYFMNTLQLSNKKNKTVVYFQADSIGQSLYRIKVTFPDTLNPVTKKDLADTLVYQATRKTITVKFN